MRRLAGGLIILSLWEILAHSGLFREIFMPSLESVVVRMVTLTSQGAFLEAALASGRRLVIGFVIAAMIGFTLGALMGRLAWIERALIRVLMALLATPAVAWVPLFMLWFGLGDRATIALIIFASTVPVAINTWSGTKSVDSTIIRAAHSMNTRGPRLFVKVILPAAMAFILAGLRLGVAQAWRALVAGELLTGTQAGLGVLITRGRTFIDTPTMLAGVLGIALLAYLSERFVFMGIERATIEKWGMQRGSV